MQQKAIKIGLVGFGTIGTGVAKIILEDADLIEAKTNLRLELACVVDTDTQSPRRVTLPEGIFTDDMDRLLKDDSISISVELIGGTGIARDIQLKLLAAGKDVVTANKALLAEHGGELYKAAHDNNRCIAFEASCCGGIPIISGLRSGLAANRIDAMYGIVNGTCNYILSNMADKNEDFAEALAQAQAKGFAEADPAIDINGGDSAHKLTILASIALGYQIHLEDVYTEGIEGISKDDLRFGGEMGYTLKLLAIARREDDGKVSLRVHPSFIHNDHPLAKVNGSFNAVSIFGSAVGQIMYYGRGAGMMPTASAVVADIIDVALGNSATTFEHLKLKPRAKVEPMIEKIENVSSRFYIRFMAKDQPGVFAHIGKILADNQVSISGVLQHEGRGANNTVPLVITTHPTRQGKINSCLDGLRKVDAVLSEPVCIRIVDIPEDID